MPRKGRRRTLARNISEDGTGRVGRWYDAAGQRRETRFPKNMPVADIRDELERRSAATHASGTAYADAGTLAAAVDAWEPLEQGLTSWTERRAELRAWCRARVDGQLLGDLNLRTIDERICRTVVSQWAVAGVAPKTIRNRLWSFKHLWKLTYGKKAETPVDDISRPPKTKTIPVIIDPAHILQVYQNLIAMEQRGLLRDAKTRARFMVRASTGKRPSEIMRAKPTDVHLARREWRVRDGKGGWSEGVYLNEDMLEAWRLFIRAKAWGTFNTGAMAKTLRSAGWAPHGEPFVRPYEMRHNVGIAMSDAGIDLADISGQLGHRDLHTTRQIYTPIRGGRMQKASLAIEGRFQGWKGAPRGTRPNKSTR